MDATDSVGETAPLRDGGAIELWRSVEGRREVVVWVRIMGSRFLGATDVGLGIPAICRSGEQHARLVTANGRLTDYSEYLMSDCM